MITSYQVQHDRPHTACTIPVSLNRACLFQNHKWKIQTNYTYAFLLTYPLKHFIDDIKTVCEIRIPIPDLNLYKDNMHLVNHVLFISSTHINNYFQLAIKKTLMLLTWQVIIVGTRFGRDTSNVLFDLSPCCKRDYGYKGWYKISHLSISNIEFTKIHCM